MLRKSLMHVTDVVLVPRNDIDLHWYDARKAGN